MNGSVATSTLHSTGNINKLRAAALTGSNVYAGVGNVNSGLPSLISDFTSNSKINSFMVNRFVNSDVGAQQLGNFSMGAVTTSNQGVPFGVATGSIVDLNLSADGKKLHLRNVRTQSQVTTALSKHGITPQDLVIRIIQSNS